jgi:hypothetical protein
MNFQQTAFYQLSSTFEEANALYRHSEAIPQVTAELLHLYQMSFDELNVLTFEKGFPRRTHKPNFILMQTSSPTNLVFLVLVLYGDGSR